MISTYHDDIAYLRLIASLPDGPRVALEIDNRWIVTLALDPAVTTEWPVLSADHVAVAGEERRVDTSEGPVIVDVPVEPTPGDRLAFVDHLGTWSTYPLMLLGPIVAVEEVLECRRTLPVILVCRAPCRWDVEV